MEITVPSQEMIDPSQSDWTGKSRRRTGHFKTKKQHLSTSKWDKKLIWSVESNGLNVTWHQKGCHWELVIRHARALGGPKRAWEGLKLRASSTWSIPSGAVFFLSILDAYNNITTSIVFFPDSSLKNMKVRVFCHICFVFFFFFCEAFSIMVLFFSLLQLDLAGSGADEDVSSL